jgi:hypothetical protein
MDSSATISPTDPRDVGPGLSTQDAELVARADQRLAHAYEQIALADEQLARVNEQISRLENEGARKNRSRRSSRGRPVLRGFIGLLLTAGICTAAFAWNSYGETARPMIAQWAPKLAAASSLPSETWKVAADTPPRVVQVAAADPAIWQSPASAQSVARDSVSPIPPETAQLLQTVVRDLASVRQEIEQLRASQEALTHETARNAEQLKESQEQTARAIAAVSERNLRSTSVAAPLPVASPARRPVATVAPTEARAQARPPVRLQPRQQ